MISKQDKVEFNPSKFEPKWQLTWESDKIFAPDLEHAKKPYMNLMMFPYPSAEGLHVGNMYAQTGADVYGRFQRMQGYDVYVPMGLDGFGIHSENYALKVGVHPIKQAKITQERFYKQMKSIGTSVDWSRTLETYDPLYYRWTQWLFIQLFKAGLAYRKKAEVNWCPSCKTVLSDEQVIPARNDTHSVAGGDGKCERCNSIVEKRELEQWFFRITKYADRLLHNIEGLDWTEKVKIAQKNWIGKKVGINIKYKVEDSNETIEVFTTRPDTNFGATFIALAPEHPLALKLTTPENKKDVERYINVSKKKSDQERKEEGREKTGVFTGVYAINDLSGYKMPVWISDFVLMGFGTGAVVGVPGHDKRDFEFAQKFGLDIIRVVVGIDGDTSPISKLEQVQEEEGKMINSEFLDGMDIYAATEKIMDYIEEKGYGKREATYHLRDWLISRQRYWGPPIPMIYCEKCAAEGKSWFTSQGVQSSQQMSKIPALPAGRQDPQSKIEISGWYPVPDTDLPVLLPDVEDWRPIGTPSAGSGQAVNSPLANHPEFYKVACPFCGKEAKRETDVSDTFLDSAWYFLGYITSSITHSIPFDKTQGRNSGQAARGKNLKTASRDIKKDQMSNVKCQMSNAPWDPKVARRWLPVKKYIGGAEHSVLHLLYARFISMVLADLKLVDFEEPFSSFFAHGLIIKDGAKMSKSKGNIVVPDTYIDKYGADTLRTYLMFLGPFSQGGDFRDSGIEGMNRFLRRVWTLLSEAQIFNLKFSIFSELSNEANFEMNKAVEKVTEDIEAFKYNTAISALMEWYNHLSKLDPPAGGPISKIEVETFLKLLAPFAPYMTEELWERVSRVSKVPSVSKGKKKQALDTPDTHGTHDTHQSIHLEKWPEYDEKYLVSSEITIVVQVNGKKRGEFTVHSSRLTDEEKIKAEAKLLIEKYLEGKEIKKVVYVSGKIVNFVI